LLSFLEFAAKINAGAGSVIQAHDQGRVDGKLQPLHRGNRIFRCPPVKNLTEKKNLGEDALSTSTYVSIPFF
jgi:hypothetical protein